MKLSGFNANNVEPNTAQVAVPAGKYTVAITASEEKPTKTGNGSYLELKMSILAGQYAGNCLYDRLNLDNPSEVAVKIAQGTLSAICRSVGVPTPDDSSELHDKPMVAVVKVKQHEGNPTNEVSGYESLKDQKVPPASAPAADGTKKSPWAK